METLVCLYYCREQVIIFSVIKNRFSFAFFSLLLKLIAALTGENLLLSSFCDRAVRQQSPAVITTNNKGRKCCVALRRRG